MLKGFALGFAIILTFVGAAAAQANHSSFYGGFNFGSALGRSSADTSTVFSPVGYFLPPSIDALDTASRQSLNGNNFTGGVEGGINIQNGNVVYGVEGDYESMRISASQSTTSTYPCCATSSFTITQSLKTGWLFTVRPRIGRQIGPSLLYATTGLAVTRVNYQAVFSDTFANANESGSFIKTKAGWAVGFGTEYQLPLEHWTIKGEYLYADFGRATTTSSNLNAFMPVLPIPSNVFTHTLELHAHIIRAGVNYRW